MQLLCYSGIHEENELALHWAVLANAPNNEGKVADEFLTFGAIYEQFAPFLFLLTQVMLLK